MSQTTLHYLYGPSIALEMIMVIGLLLSLTKPSYLAIAILGINLLRPNERFPMSISLPLAGFCLMIISLLIHYRKQGQFISAREDRPLFLLVLFVMVHTLLFYPSNTVGSFMTCGFGFLCYAYCISFLSSRKGIMLLNYALWIICLFICMEPLYYHFASPEHSLIWASFHSGGRLTAWGMWRNANETAFLACLGCANILMPCLREKKTAAALGALVSLPVFFSIIYMSGSRAGIISFSLFFFVIAFALKSKLVKSIAMLLVLACVIILPIVISHRTDTVASSLERADLRWAGRQMFLNNPLRGVGFNRAQDEVGMGLHNTYLQAFAETGFVGGTLFIYYLYLVGFDLFRRWRTYLKMKSVGADGLNAISPVLGLYACSMFYFALGNQLLSILFFTVIAAMRVARFPANANAVAVPATQRVRLS